MRHHSGRRGGLLPALLGIIDAFGGIGLSKMPDAHGHRRAVGLPSPEVLPAMVREIVAPGDYVVCLGAGNITQWAYALPDQLAAGGAQ